LHFPFKLVEVLKKLDNEAAAGPLLSGYLPGDASEKPTAPLQKPVSYSNSRPSARLDDTNPLPIAFQA
jgi:hypothetical protein